MRILLRLGLGLCLALTVASSPAAATLLQDDRLVQGLGTGGFGTMTPSVPFQAWTAPGQTSSVTETLMQGTGNGSTESDSEFSALRTRFDVTFSLSVLTDVVLSGEMTYDDFAFAGMSFEASLSDTSSTLFSIPSDAGFWDEQFDFGASARQELAYSATLGPGTYQLIFDVNPSGGNGQGTFDFTATLTPVPEPGTALLVATGLAALGVQRPRYRA